jgi:hypothetical protein
MRTVSFQFSTATLQGSKSVASSLGLFVQADVVLEVTALRQAAKSRVRAAECRFPSLLISTPQEPQPLAWSETTKERWRPMWATAATDKAKFQLLGWRPSVQGFIDYNSTGHVPPIEPRIGKCGLNCAHHDQRGLVGNPVLLSGVQLRQHQKEDDCGFR